MREALFGRLGDLSQAAVLDAYAGSGALGAEALSRGAASVVFLERAPACLAALRANLDSLGVGAEARVVSGDAVRAIGRLGRAGERFDLVLLDPPYASGEHARALEALVASAVLADGAMVVVESAWRQPPPDVDGLEVVDRRRYGDTLITRLAPTAVAATEPGDPEAR